MFIPQHHSGHAICLRPVGAVADADLLARLGLTGWLPAEFGLCREYAVPAVTVAEVGDWTVVADGLSYSLWNRVETHECVPALAAAVGEVFVAFTADCWGTFEFRYYRDGQLVRQYTADAESGKPDRILKSVGEPLPGEAATPELSDGWTGLYRVAAALGIDPTAGVRNRRVLHAPPRTPGQR
ncbi:MAG: hypothetical protein U0871_15390 [Gemmataceae bacterium]